jgi:hypothetical protein
LPLFVTGTWIEAKRIWTQIIVKVQNHGFKDEGPAIITLALTTFVLAFTIGWSFWSGLRGLVKQGEQRYVSGFEKRETYDWLRENASSKSRVIAYEDGSLYLYSGLQALRPIIFQPAERFEPAILPKELQCISESSKKIRAVYWVVSEDDFDFEWQPPTTLGLWSEKEYLAKFPLLFRSKSGRVSVYRIDSQSGSSR